jgi:hypothetical protein
MNSIWRELAMTDLKPGGKPPFPTSILLRDELDLERAAMTASSRAVALQKATVADRIPLPDCWWNFL